MSFVLLSREYLQGVEDLAFELIADFEKRVVASFLALIGAPGWTTMLVVAHEAVNRMLLGLSVTHDMSGVGNQ